VATDASSYALITYTNSARPGENIVLWGSGLGADTADSDVSYTSTPHAVNGPITVYVGGIAVTPTYAGSSGYPGLNQINLTVPSGVATGCGVSVVVETGSGATVNVSNSMLLPIGSGVCSDPLLGYNGTQIQNQVLTGTFNSGSLGLTQGTSSQNGVTTQIYGSFQSYQNFSVSGVSNSPVSLGSCYVTVGGGNISSSGSSTGLDAGTITVNGPAGSMTLTENTYPMQTGVSGSYGGQIANSFLPATGGTYTWTGSGGKDVGPFTTTASIGNLVSWTNMSSISSVTRASGQLVTWSGGSSSSFVYVGGTSASTSGSASATFVCYAPASAGQLTVPSYVLLALPSGTGSLGVSNSGTPGTFTASGLTGPGSAIIGVSSSINTKYN
jgi:hypothetical protein